MKFERSNPLTAWKALIGSGDVVAAKQDESQQEFHTLPHAWK